MMSDHNQLEENLQFLSGTYIWMQKVRNDGLIPLWDVADNRILKFDLPKVRERKYFESLSLISNTLLFYPKLYITQKTF